MTRIRTIKPEFWGDEKLSAESDSTRLLFIALWSMADDAGRVIDSLAQITAFVHPGCDDPEVFTERSRVTRESLARLAITRRIARGVTASGQRVIQIVNWARHQKIDRPSNRGLLPEIVEPADVTPVDAATLASDSRDSREDASIPSRESREDSSRVSRDTRDTTLDLGPRTKEQEPRAPASADAPASALAPTRTRGHPAAAAAVAAAGSQSLDTDAVTLTVAANQAITTRFGEQPSPLLSSAGTSHAVAKALREASVPVAFAAEVIRDVVARAGFERPPRSLTYFRPAILDAWAAEGAHQAARSACRPEVQARAAWWDTICFDYGWHRTSPHQRPEKLEVLRRDGVLTPAIETQFQAEHTAIAAARLLRDDLYADAARPRAVVLREFARVLGAAMEASAA